MSAQIIDGRLLAKTITQQLKNDLAKKPNSRPPGLATVLVGNNPASEVYVTNKRKTAEAIGIKSFHFSLPEKSTQAEVFQLIHTLNHDEKIDGILVQLPLPKHINDQAIIAALAVEKDVDGFHPLNLGYLVSAHPKTIACTPQAIMHIIASINYDLKGKHAVVIGRSTIVGKPTALLLLEKDATVTVCHSHTHELARITRDADVLVVAAGQPKFIKKTHIKKGAVVIDVGINRDENNKICGDVDFDDVLDQAGFITPVPGGVGPLTIAMLLNNTVNNFIRTH